MYDYFHMFIAGVVTGTTILLAFLTFSNRFVKVETDIITNTKYVEYNNSTYILTPCKNIIKEK